MVANPQLFRNPFKATSVILNAAKAALKAVIPEVALPAAEAFPACEVDNGYEQERVEKAEVARPSLASEESLQQASMDVQLSVENVEDISPVIQPHPKKAKLSSEVLPRDPRLRNKITTLLSTSPELPHKVPVGGEGRHCPEGGELRHGAVEGELLYDPPGAKHVHVPVTGGELRHVVGTENLGEVVSGDAAAELPSGVEKSKDGSDDGREKSNFHGINYLLWFEVGIEGKDPMDPNEEDWGGKIEFGFSDINFAKDFEDYFILFEDQCTIHNCCVGRVSGLQAHIRDKVLLPPSYDERNIVNLIEKYGDAHLSNSGWREVDPEEWYEDS